MNLSEFDPTMVIDAKGCVLGRVASTVAERALDGERIAIVNAESAVVTGREEEVIERYRTRRELGSDRGPYHPRRPDGIFKRTVRGMLPMDRDRGRDAFRNVRVYLGNPLEDEEATVLEDTTVDRLSTIKFQELGDISAQLGANVTW